MNFRNFKYILNRVSRIRRISNARKVNMRLPGAGRTARAPRALTQLPLCFFKTSTLIGCDCWESGSSSAGRSSFRDNLYVLLHLSLNLTSVHDPRFLSDLLYVFYWLRYSVIDCGCCSI